MCSNNLLYNIDEIVIPSGMFCRYTCFLKALDNNLKSKYPKYYKGVQLYNSNEDNNKFFVVSVYEDTPDIYFRIKDIEKEIGDLYFSIWGDCIKCISVFTFKDCRIINFK